MKRRIGFVSNSSSSSFIIHMTKEMSNKFHKTFFRTATYPKMTYEYYHCISDEQNLLDYFKTQYLEKLLVADLKLCKDTNELDFEPMSEYMFKKTITENISYYQEQVDEYKKNLYNSSIEQTTNEEERKYQEENIAYYKELIDSYEKYVLRDTQLRDKGSIEYLKSEECKKVQNEFHSMLKVLKTQDIWDINFRRDGEAPESDFEDYLSKLSEQDFVDYMKTKHKINIKKIEKENL